ncbi:FAD:protein FMN transferase [Muribaculum sp.]|uniref:FAD:protein FMN transferase n=1 Tax=Muribaculum sp. TaxID=1918611 RepID=UPI0025799C04|nr:FAD:protein FMN transferase [Muribaculum sp.]
MKDFVKATLSVLLILFSISACTSPMPYQHAEGMTWGTTFHITYSSNAPLDDSIKAVLSTIDNSLSPFNDKSLLSGINSGATDSTDTFFRKVFSESVYINRISGGAFDPTIAPIIDLWGFGPKGAISATPTDAQIDSAMAHVGIDKCHINSDNRIVKKTPYTQFNFSAIAKGFGCDLLAQMLERNGVKNFIIEIGGEIVVRGTSPRKTPWRVMIDAPIPGNDTIIHEDMAVIEADSCAIATSGNYRNYHLVDSTNIGHTMNPATGRPAKLDMLSVTIIAPTCMLADALATCCMAMQLDSAIQLINTIPNVEALFVTPMGNEGKWMVHTTPGFPERSR